MGASVNPSAVVNRAPCGHLRAPPRPVPGKRPCRLASASSGRSGREPRLTLTRRSRRSPATPGLEVHQRERTEPARNIEGPAIQV